MYIFACVRACVGAPELCYVYAFRYSDLSAGGTEIDVMIVGDVGVLKVSVWESPRNNDDTRVSTIYLCICAFVYILMLCRCLDIFG